MKWLRICALIALTLLAMRAVSRLFGWVLSRLVRGNRRLVAVASNVCALAAFILLLLYSRLPGEELDSGALLFGVVVYAAYCIRDLRSTKWSWFFSRRTPRHGDSL
jgi:hypothetical protein